MTRERFLQTNWKMSFEEFQTCDCTQCNRKCIHKEAFRRVPIIDGGLELCSKLKKRKEKIKSIILSKCNERDIAGYDSLNDSDIMDILEKCERNRVKMSREEIRKLRFT